MLQLGNLIHKYLIFGFEILLILIAGCVDTPAREYAHLVGYLLHHSDALVPDWPPAPPLDNIGIVLRDPHTNALEITLSPPRSFQLLSSTVPRTHILSLNFSSSKELPREIPEVFLPITISEHISLEKVFISSSRKQIVIMISTDKLGADLLLATLFSPRGIQGVAFFKSAPLVLPLEARAEQPWFAWATVWAKSATASGKEIMVRSEVEYPVIIDQISLTTKNGLTLSQCVGKRLKPRDSFKIKLPVSVSDINWNLVKFSKRAERTVPATFQQAIK